MCIEAKEVKKVFQDFKVGSVLGEGGEGIVFKVLEKKTGVHRALKILRKKTDTTIRQFEKEGRLLNEFEHPNIVKVFEYGKKEHLHYILMEYCSHGSLLELIADKSFSDEEAGNLVIKVAAGLQYAHEKQVLHRDIKPENVMITENDEPKLVDFGLAFCAGEDLNALEAVGSEGYAAPEIWKTPAKVSLQTDLYAMGALMYTVLTRVFPDPHNVNFNHLFDRDQAFIHFIVKAMSKDPARRHSNAIQFADDIRDIVNNIGKPQNLW